MRLAMRVTMSQSRTSIRDLLPPFLEPNYKTYLQIPRRITTTTEKIKLAEIAELAHHQLLHPSLALIADLKLAKHPDLKKHIQHLPHTIWSYRSKTHIHNALNLPIPNYAHLDPTKPLRQQEAATMLGWGRVAMHKQINKGNIPITPDRKVLTATLINLQHGILSDSPDHAAALYANAATTAPKAKSP